MSEGRLLIVNGDDFGLTPGVCRGILRGHRDGILTSTSALVVAPAFADHAASLRDSGIGVGLHVALVGEDPPVLTAAEVPSLVDDRGRLAPDWRSFLGRAARGAVDPADVAREAGAQADVLADAGIVATHVDSHQNLHLWPSVAGVVVGLAGARGIGALRVPRSRRWGVTGLGVRALGRGLARRAQRAGLRLPSDAVGLDEAGSWDPTSLASAVARVGAGADGAVEVATHPGEDPDPDRARYRWGYRWAEELAALCDPRVRAAVERAGLRLGTFADIG